MSFLRNTVLAGLFLVPPTLASQAKAQWIVHDPANGVVLIEQLAHQAQEIDNQVQQIQNQIQSLQNESRMLQHLNISNAQQAVGVMLQMEQTLKQFCVEMQDEGSIDPIGFSAGLNCALVAQLIRAAYPAPQDWHAQPDTQIAQYPDQWSAAQRGAAAKAIQMQDASVASMDGTQQRMSDLASASQNAPGQTAAIQATNEMLVTISAQLRDQQTAELATQRSLALEQSEESAEYERNKELVNRATWDSQTTYDVAPVSEPFTQAN
jgi:P-type conjugative transfer protein TrbJ